VKVFIDTSAFYADLHVEDRQHHRAREFLAQLKESEFKLVTTNYVLLECTSLIQRRKDFTFAYGFLSEATQHLEVIWIDEQLQREAMVIWKQAGRRELSLVDCASFAAMKHARIHRVFAFDPHFTQYGFEVVA